MPSLARAARTFLESWLIRKDYDAAFRYISPASYACYDLARSPEAPASTSLDDAGQRLRANFARAGDLSARCAARRAYRGRASSPSTRRFA